MRNWVIGGALVGIAAVLGQQFFTRPNPPAGRAPVPVTVAAAVTPKFPTPAVVLAQVIDVTDIDALLDPPPPPAGAVAAFYETVDEFTPVGHIRLDGTPLPAPIPPANDDNEPAARGGWYGPGRLPRQLTERAAPAKDYWLAPGAGVGVYF